MDSSTPHPRQLTSRMSSVDVSRLDKINAIPNKTTNNVLLDGLCPEDQLYLDALMDEDSIDSDEDLSSAGSPWSPAMAERPRMNSKRVKRLKPSYTITMSLEDISYIRPSWGMSKGFAKKLEEAQKAGNSPSQRARFGRRADAKIISSAKPLEQNTNANHNNTVPGGQEQGASNSGKGPILNTYNVSLVILMLILSFLMLLSYYVDLARHQERTLRLGVELKPRERILSILRLKDGQVVANRELTVHYARGIASNLKHDECTCRMYHAEARRYSSGKLDRDQRRNETDKCFACFDWAQRANLQVIVNSTRSHGDSEEKEEEDDDDDDDDDDNNATAGDARSPDTRTGASGPPAPLDEDLSITCYDIRWQSYDSLRTPLVDCIRLSEGDQWFGLGDTHTSPTVWPLNKLNRPHGDSAQPLTSNLSGEFGASQPLPVDRFYSTTTPTQSPGDLAASGGSLLAMGSQVAFELVSSSGLYLGNLRSDFQASVQISAERREICLSAACTDRCAPTWSKLGHLTGKQKLQNNLLEYSICSASSWKVLVSRLINQRLRRAAKRLVSSASPTGRPPAAAAAAVAVASADRQPKSGAQSVGAKQVESIESNEAVQKQRPYQHSRSASSTSAVQQAFAALSDTAQQRPLAAKRPFEPIGLVERTIFVTSQEYIPTLDGQTLLKHVDKIVNLNLKTSPILVLDTRWQTYSGSFRVNSAYFPKAKLMFEILHNKGFKIVLTIKPYLDMNIVMSALYPLLESQRLVTVTQYSSSQSVARVARTPFATTLKSANGWRAHDGVASTQDEPAPPRLPFFHTQVLRRESFFRFTNQTVVWFNRTRAHEDVVTAAAAASKRPPPPPPPAPYLFNCRESHGGLCALLDLTLANNRQWLIDAIRRSSFLSQEADGLLLAGAHPEPREWEAGFREAMAELTDELFYGHNYYVIPQWTGNFNYLQLAPRSRDWDSLRSLVDSVLTLGMLGVSLVHPGSVWGDVSAPNRVRPTGKPGPNAAPRSGRNLLDPGEAEDAADRAQRELLDEQELIVRWLQVAVFLPVLQFNDLSPIDAHNLHDQLQQLVRLRKTHIVPEIKKNLPYTALLQPAQSATFNANNGNRSTASPAGRTRHSTRGPAGPLPYQLPALRYTWASGPLVSAASQQHRRPSEPQPEAVGQQFMVGPDVLVAPVLQAGQRQKDIYLPVGMWHDELRQTNIRGSKWLRNYPIELNEIAWFTRARR